MLSKPNFLVLGAPKCGTSSFYHYLKQHRELFLCPKEVHYFICNDPGYGAVAVRTWSDYAELFSGAGPSVAGEVAVRYLYSANARLEISRRLPHAKLFVLVRNPIERAFSQFLMRYRTGGGDQIGGRVIPTPSDIEVAFENLNRDFIQWGRYGHYLEPWYEAFPAEQIFVLQSEYLQSHAAATMKQVFDFLGVDSQIEVDTSVRYNVSKAKDFNPWLVRLKRVAWIRNVRNNRMLRRCVRRLIPSKLVDSMQWRPESRGDHIRKVVAMPEAVQNRLRDYYASDVSKLESLTGQRFDNWLTEVIRSPLDE